MALVIRIRFLRLFLGKFGAPAAFVGLHGMDEQLAVGQNQWYHFGVGAPPILVYFSGDWDVQWGYGLLTHQSKVAVNVQVQSFILARKEPVLFVVASL